MAEPLSRPPHARTHRPLFTSLGGDCRWWSHRFLRPEKTRSPILHPPFSYYQSLSMCAECMDVAAFIGRRSFVSAFSSSSFLYIYISRYIVQRVYIEMYMYLVRLRDRWRRAWYIRDKRYFFPFSSHGRFQTSSAGQSTYNNGIGSSEYTEEESCDGWCDVSRRLTQTPRNLPNSYIRVVYIV